MEPDLEKKRLNFMIFQKHMETRYFLNIFPIYLNDLNELDLSGIMAVESHIDEDFSRFRAGRFWSD